MYVDAWYDSIFVEVYGVVGFGRWGMGKNGQTWRIKKGKENDRKGNREW